MNKRNIPSISIGITTLITIFIVICISIFSVLSFAQANNDSKLSKKSLEYINSYNTADVYMEKVISYIKSIDDINSQEVKDILYECNGYLENTDTYKYNIFIPINDKIYLKSVIEYSPKMKEISRSTYSEQEEIDEKLNLFDVSDIVID